MKQQLNDQRKISKKRNNIPLQDKMGLRNFALQVVNVKAKSNAELEKWKLSRDTVILKIKASGPS